MSRRTAGLLCALVGLAACQDRSDVAAERPDAPAAAASFRRPLAVPAARDPAAVAKVALGRTLFFDRRLSGSGAIACATCHDPSRGWQDGRPTGVGHNGAHLPRRTPAVVDVAWVEPLFWDGRAATLEEQAAGPLTSAQEMNLPAAQAVARVRGIRGYRPLFRAAFPGRPVTLDTITGAIAAYERTIVSTPAPFDRWVDGEPAAISPAAKRGFGLFVGKAGCADCHSGWRFTDDGFRDIGLPSQDLGRGKLFPDVPMLQHAFKTPTLRDVAGRAPYMHDGSLATLEAVVDHYNAGFVRRASLAPQMRPLGLTPRDRSDLVAFMETLSSRRRSQIAALGPPQ